MSVTNLHKLFWPGQKLTKGDLFRYYVQVAPFLLPAIADRPLVMKRFPNGVAGQPFYQHRAADVPAGVRVESVPAPNEGSGARSHVIGGSLLTLLYTTQLAALSQDPWFSRVESPGDADYAALDLDPSPGVSPSARCSTSLAGFAMSWPSIGAVGIPKTSGADGVHVYIPLPPETPYEAGLLFCQIVATVVANKHPREATVERSLRGARQARLRRLSAERARQDPGVRIQCARQRRCRRVDAATLGGSRHGVAREDFTIASVPARLSQVGDLWAELRESKGVDLSRVNRF